MSIKSQFGTKFNHDGWEAIYDADVADETNPIRAGYDACLDWVVKKAAVTANDTVVDLGIGTGNLAQRLPTCHHLIGVDLSTQMMAVAKDKLTKQPNLSFVENDLLAYFNHAPQLDVVVSTYAVHHLTEPEKASLFQAIDAVLVTGGRAIFGDLAFADKAARASAIAHYNATDRKDIAFDIEDEFFWLLDGCVAAMQQLGWTVEAVQFSALSWGIAAQK